MALGAAIAIASLYMLQEPSSSRVPPKVPESWFAALQNALLEVKSFAVNYIAPFINDFLSGAKQIIYSLKELIKAKAPEFKDYLWRTIDDFQLATSVLLRKYRPIVKRHAQTFSKACWDSMLRGVGEVTEFVNKYIPILENSFFDSMKFLKQSTSRIASQLNSYANDTLNALASRFGIEEEFEAVTDQVSSWASSFWNNIKKRLVS
jgi:hypothetical protein